MEFSITATTRSRKFTKALVRHSHAISGLKRVAAYVNAVGLSFDVLQLVFLDRSEDYTRAVGCKGDRLFQVEVPTPREEAVDYGDEAAFVAYIATHLQKAVRLCGLPEEVESQIIEAITRFETGDR